MIKSCTGNLQLCVVLIVFLFFLPSFCLIEAFLSILYSVRGLFFSKHGALNWAEFVKTVFPGVVDVNVIISRLMVMLWFLRRVVRGVVVRLPIRGHVSGRGSLPTTGKVMEFCAVFDTPTTHLTLAHSYPSIILFFCKHCVTKAFISNTN